MADNNALPEKHDSSADSNLPSESLSHVKKHKFWETQPVGQFKDLGDSSLPEGPTEQPTPLSEVKQEPYNLPTPYEWITCDMDSGEMCNEVYALLSNNYVEDVDSMFRFNYSKEFLYWALHPPGYYRSWHIGVRVKNSKKLVAFITGVPAKIRVRDTVFVMAEINFLCVHKKLRSKRLTPVMIKEVTRRVQLENIWQAAYTAGVDQWKNDKEQDNKAVQVTRSNSDSRVSKDGTHDVPAVSRLLKNYLKKLIVAPDFDEDDVEHWLLPKEIVVDSYLVESPETHEITDFCSFYTLPSSILGNQNHSTLKAAYSFYNVSTKTPLIQLMNDALIVAKKNDFDVFNALDVMNNETFLKELKFVPGDGKLHYYLDNYHLKQALRPSELGLVLL
ncbi:glycylpeptide N-tetradecanoyltransferase 1-like [Olea europaea subsp. europaea]|uniref:Glycylpeptide N-tetradecanoyltransferase n=1 Tax=Olea europaea subsp. europaea TaxID=158383 RepID=A0A8S0UKJ7_OLEEU|nr:glycylpeptide N-tetradecanoyltransferase 1-like [Olea europaea subsp. europaea]